MLLLSRSEPEGGPDGDSDRDSSGEDDAGGGAAGARRIFAALPGVVKKAPHKHKKIKVGEPPPPCKIS